MGPNQSQHKHKKQLLEKLMGNLLGKPTRSFHEISNGVKQAISTYKNFSKEWDQLHGVMPQSAGSNGVQRVMDTVKQNKSKADGSGGPGMPAQAGGNPQFKPMPAQAQGVPQRQEMPAPRAMPPQMGSAPANAIPPVHPMPPMQPMDAQPAVPPVRVNGGEPVSPIAGQPQQSSFNRPAPVNSLGIWGH